MGDTMKAGKEPDTKLVPYATVVTTTEEASSILRSYVRKCYGKKNLLRFRIHIQKKRAHFVIEKKWLVKLGLLDGGRRDEYRKLPTHKTDKLKDMAFIKEFLNRDDVYCIIGEDTGEEVYCENYDSLVEQYKNITNIKYTIYIGVMLLIILVSFCLTWLLSPLFISV